MWDFDAIFYSPIVKGIVAIDIKMKGKFENVYCEICECNVRKSGWGKHEKTNKHIVNAKGGEVEKVAKRRCGSCWCEKEFEMFNGENVTCNVCLERWKRWAGKNGEKKKEIDRKWREENREKKMEYDREYSLIKVWCERCECNVRKCKWSRHEKTEKHKLGGGGGKVDGAGR